MGRALASEALSGNGLGLAGSRGLGSATGLGNNDFGVVRGAGLELILGAKDCGRVTAATELGYFCTWNAGTRRPAQDENHQNRLVTVANTTKILTCIKHHKKYQLIPRQNIPPEYSLFTCYPDFKTRLAKPGQKFH
jgi:hypothetical protein